MDNVELQKNQKWHDIKTNEIYYLYQNDYNVDGLFRFRKLGCTYKLQKNVLLKKTRLKNVHANLLKHNHLA